MAVIATVAVRPFARRLAAAPPARSICDSSQPPKMSPWGLASAGMAIVRIAGSICGGALGRSVIGTPWIVSERRAVVIAPRLTVVAHMLNPRVKKLQGGKWRKTIGA